MAQTKSRLGRGLGSLISGGINKTAINSNNNENEISEIVKVKSKVSAKKKKSIAKKSKPTVEKKIAAKTEQPKKNLEHSIKNNNTIPDGFSEISVEKIKPNPYQPRRHIEHEKVVELAESIRSEGLLQPIIVRKVKDEFQLIAGERRWRACQHLKLKSIPVRILDASDASSAVISLIENLQRENLNPIDESLGYASLMKDFALTQESVAERVGKGRATIANSLRLLHLDKEIQGYVSKGLLSVGHAKVLLGLENSMQQLLIGRRVLENGLSVRDTETAVQNIKTEKKGGPIRKSSSENDNVIINDLQKQFTSYLKTPVTFKHTPKRGKIVINYYGNDDLQRIMEKLGVV